MPPWLTSSNRPPSLHRPGLGWPRQCARALARLSRSTRGRGRGARAQQAAPQLFNRSGDAARLIRRWPSGEPCTHATPAVRLAGNLEKQENSTGDLGDGRAGRHAPPRLRWDDHDHGGQDGSASDGDNEGHQDQDGVADHLAGELDVLPESIGPGADPRACCNWRGLHRSRRCGWCLGIGWDQLSDRNLLSGRLLVHIQPAFAERRVPLGQMRLRRRGRHLRQWRIASRCRPRTAAPARGRSGRRGGCRGSHSAHSFIAPACGSSFSCIGRTRAPRRQQTGDRSRDSCGQRGREQSEVVAEGTEGRVGLVGSLLDSEGGKRDRDHDR